MTHYHKVSLLSGLGRAILITIWVELALGTIMMGARIYTNHSILRLWKCSFWLVLVSYILAFQATILCTIAIFRGIGSHESDLNALDPRLVPHCKLLILVASNFTVLSVSFSKNSIVAFILEIQGRTIKQGHLWFLYALAAIDFVFGFANVPLMWTSCSPMAKIWDAAVPGHCEGPMPGIIFAYCQGSFGILMDLILALYPITLFWNLQLPLRRKISLSMLFVVGLFACVTTIFKTSKLKVLGATEDITYHMSYLVVGLATEMWVVIIVSCVPAVRPLFVKQAKNSTQSNTIITTSNIRLSAVQTPDKSRSRIEMADADMDSMKSSIGNKSDERRDTVEPGSMVIATEMT